jgi:hypothetical protein
MPLSYLSSGLGRFSSTSTGAHRLDRVGGARLAQVGEGTGVDTADVLGTIYGSQRGQHRLAPSPPLR